MQHVCNVAHTAGRYPHDISIRTQHRHTLTAKYSWQAGHDCDSPKIYLTSRKTLTQWT